jgi:membrane-associated protein
MLDQLVQWILLLWDFVIHVDVHLANIVAAMGPWTYAILFLIVFCETGLVVTPILPGDSLLFAAGAIAALPDSPLNPVLLAGVMICAALCGDLTNYTIGKHIGPRIFRADAAAASEQSLLARLMNRKHLEKTQRFYERYGGKTIILARFVPIVRTFAPFVAGVGRMAFPRYAAFCVTGALLWVVPFLFGGYFLGNLPAVKTNFHIVVVAIIVISVMPAVIEVIRARRQRAQAVA